MTMPEHTSRKALHKAISLIFIRNTTMILNKFNLINNAVDTCIHLLITDNEKYFDDFINNDDFYISFNESIIWDIRKALQNKLNSLDWGDSYPIYSFIDNTLDYLLESDKAHFIKHFQYQVNKLYNPSENDSVPLYSYQY